MHLYGYLMQFPIDQYYIDWTDDLLPHTTASDLMQMQIDWLAVGFPIGPLNSVQQKWSGDEDAILMKVSGSVEDDRRRKAHKICMADLISPYGKAVGPTLPT